jgi:hypothetical protein
VNRILSTRGKRIRVGFLQNPVLQSIGDPDRIRNPKQPDYGSGIPVVGVGSGLNEKSGLEVERIISVRIINRLVTSQNLAGSIFKVIFVML